MASRYFTLSLQAKLVLAAVSASFSWMLSVLADLSEAFNEFFANRATGLHLIAIAFGALVMAPYVSSSSRRVLRIVGMCIASAAIYYGAVRFVADGPLNYNTTVPFLISGGSAALLVGLTVALLAPRSLHWSLIPLTLVAGAVGGVAFDWSLDASLDGTQFAGYAAWQGLVCLALHFSFRETPT